MALLGSTTLWLLLATARAEEPTEPSLTADQAVGFADHLLESDDPFNALTYYRLALYLDPEREDSGELRFRMALCYERGARFDAAEQAYLDVAGRAPALSLRSTYRAGMTAAASGHPDVAKLHFSEVQLEDPASPWAERAAFSVAVVSLEAGEPEQADAELAAFLERFTGSPLGARATAARGVLAKKVRKRSPGFAGFLSVLVPGAGQVYAGHAGDGVMSFVVNGGLGLWSYTLLRHGIEEQVTWEVGVGSAMATAAAFGWTANVLGAVRGAKRRNAHKRRRLAEEALQETFDPSLERDPGDVAP